MLLQSNGQNSRIHFLPALPESAEWSQGSVKGMQARNGFEVNFEWDNSKLKKGEIISKNEADCYLKLPLNMAVYHSNGKKVSLKAKANDVVVFPTKKGNSYFVK
ncbi:glycoside hydrolase family 95-like protein [Flavobacterium sp. XN-5]|uniref:glycoside hydrolase family 95-like protein n=1 Tax=Flavobacterium sp. XN-5 TaxID=2599390 RepID=UPI003977A1C5